MSARQRDLVTLIRNKSGALIDLATELRGHLAELEAAGGVDALDDDAFAGANQEVDRPKMAAAVTALGELDGALATRAPTLYKIRT